MDDQRFDRLARVIASAPDRRRLLRGAIGGTLLALLGAKRAAADKGGLQRRCRVEGQPCSQDNQCCTSTSIGMAMVCGADGRCGPCPNGVSTACPAKGGDRICCDSNESLPRFAVLSYPPVLSDRLLRRGVGLPSVEAGCAARSEICGRTCCPRACPASTQFNSVCGT